MFPGLPLLQSTESPSWKNPCEPSSRSIRLPNFPPPPPPTQPVRNNPKLYSWLPTPTPPFSLLSHSLIKETMKRTHQDILVQTVISSNKLLPHLVTFMGQRNHMAHAGSSRSTLANSMLILPILIILKDCGVPNSKVFHHPNFPAACNSLSIIVLPSLLALLSPAPPSIDSCAWFAVSGSLFASIFLGESSGGGTFLRNLLAQVMYFSTSLS